MSRSDEPIRDRSTESDYASLPKRRRGVWMTLTSPREFVRAVLEVFENAAGDPFIVGGLIGGVVVGGVTLWLGASWPLALGVAIVTAAAIGVSQVLF